MYHHAKPASNSGMKVLDRQKFNAIISCKAVVTAEKNCTLIITALKSKPVIFNHLQKKPKLVFDHPSMKGYKCIFIQDPNDPDLIEVLKETNSSVENVNIKLGYQHFNVTQILRSILPETISDTDIVSSFEIVGHIAHLNLKECHAEYKNIIGQIILDKNPCIKTVVNKTGIINSEFRFFDMEVIAGDNDFITTTIENKIKYRLDYSKVYWNSKLGTEHSRIVHKIPTQSVVLDMFCGIGPFAIPLAKKGCIVHANDLNPNSFRYLKINVKENKIPTENIQCYNQDGREFIKNFQKKFDFVIMNLPASATSFLDVFKGLFASSGLLNKEPVIFCYHFADVSNAMHDSIKAAETVLGTIIRNPDVYMVRKTAPKTWMTCLEFQMPMDILQSEPSSKRHKPS